MNETFLVLVVEDDEMARNVIVDILRDDGFKTEEAEGFQTALQIFAPKKFHVAILDNRLADGEGIELCRQLKAQDPTLKIFLFAGATDELRLAALEAGATEILQKPYDLTKLPFLLKRESRRTVSEDGSAHEKSSAG